MPAHLPYWQGHAHEIAHCRSRQLTLSVMALSEPFYPLFLALFLALRDNEEMIQLGIGWCVSLIARKSV